MTSEIIFITLVIILFYNFYNTKDTFYNVTQEEEDLYNDYYKNHFFTNQVQQASVNKDISKVELAGLFRDILTYANGPPGGANVNVTQNKYDLLFKDIVISSDKRNKIKYPNPNKYTIHLNNKFDKIYKAELIDVYIPAATDISVNIPTNGNRLYFKYNDFTGYIVVQAGTYNSPESLAKELSRQFYNVLTSAGVVYSKTVGVCVEYDKNLNRYILKDKQYILPATLII